eukprot:EG_transcript_19505
MIVNHHNEQRWQWMKYLTKQVGLKPIRSQSYNWANKSARVPAEIIFGSLRPRKLQVMPDLLSDAWRAAMVTMSHRKAWLQFGTDPTMAEDDWALFFEDDCNITRKANYTTVRRIIRTGLRVAEQHNQSFIYFGIEGNPACKPGLAAVPLLGGFAYFRHCYGKGAHSYALQKWFAREFWERLRAQRFAHPCVAVKKRHCINGMTGVRARGTALCCRNATLASSLWVPDVRLGNDWGPDSWMQPYCAYHGCPIVDHEAGVLESVFYQERTKFPTQVWWDAMGISRSKQARLDHSLNSTSPGRRRR